MKTIQIRVPDDLFRELRRIAEKRGWSIDETFHRGAELLLQVDSRTPAGGDREWTPPTCSRVGWKGLTGDQLREAFFADVDP